jgi:hypothetical protein
MELRSLGFAEGMARGLMGGFPPSDTPKMFDWDKAAQILAERRPESAAAGLAEDWGCTGGVIWDDGKPQKDSSAYLSSVWATPVLVIGDEVIPCWKRFDNHGHAGEHWPPSALALVEGGDPTPLVVENPSYPRGNRA